jgi:serpin B
MASYSGTATGYVAGPNYQAVELPYSGNTTSMIVILPNASAYAAVEASLGDSLFADVTSSLSYNAPIDLVFPSFKIHGGSISLVPELQALGMTDAFQPDADFTSMIPAGKVYISDVVHQAFVDVDESGTEAAAATAIVGGAEVSSETQPISVTVNRAFFFFIRDVATNTILFVGRENDPTAT